MGGGTYSTTSRSYRAETEGYYTKSTNEIFTQRTIDNKMSPKEAQLRESRDSEEHPSSLAIIIALDVTGSMGSVPTHLIQDGLPNIMGSMVQKGINDAQILFLGIGDHECDDHPLQVGQFETSDELLDRWLTSVYLEGGGGGNCAESYNLAWYYAAYHTSIDCFEKRGQKGILITIGDEPFLKNIRSNDLNNIMGKGQYQNFKSEDLYNAAKEKYNVFHLHLTDTPCSISDRQESWKKLLGQDFILLNDHSKVSDTISNLIMNNINVFEDSIVKDNIEDDTLIENVKEDDSKEQKEEIML